MMNRVGVAFFYDESGIVDDYYILLLRELRVFLSRIVVVVNGHLTVESERSLRSLTDELLIRENIGFDVAAYKFGLDYVGFDNLGAYDELILFNHTFFGPLFPLEEMFSAMECRVCDFWGVSAHREVRPNPFTGGSVLPFHLNSHFVAVRSSIAGSNHFKEYWRALPEINSYNESILLHETKFTKHFQDLGFSVEVYLDPNKLGTDYGLLEEVDFAIANRCPIIKRRSFFVDPALADKLALDLPRALAELSKAAKYDVRLIWTNLLRMHELRILHTNAALMSILDSQMPSNRGAWVHLRIAVCVHVYYTDTLDELISYCENIPIPFDLIVTTDNVSKKVAIQDFLDERRRVLEVRSAVVLIVEKNVGADTSALLITCRDYMLHGNYDLVCRLHSKKSPQDGAGRARFFKRHLFENLIYSKGYVANVLKLFADDDQLGIAFPPAIHVHYGTLGYGWFGNRPRTERVATEIGVKVRFDESTPLAPFGGMFWFRPAALEKLFRHQWKWRDFEHDKTYGDGDLPHAIERLYAYVAQDAGFTPRTIASRNQTEQNYVRLEFKLQKLLSLIPQGNFADNCIALESWKGAGFPMPTSSRRPVASSSETGRVALTPAARARVAVELLQSEDRYWWQAMKHLKRRWDSRTKMNFYIDGINGVPNPGLAVLRFSKAATENLRIEGWALTPGAKSCFEAVLVRLEGAGGRFVEISIPSERSDVANHFGCADLLRCGFECKLPISGMSRGAYTIQVVGITRLGKRFPGRSGTTIVLD